MIFKGHGLVYIPKTNKFVRFTEGLLETEDPAVIEQLKGRGYESDGKEPEEPKAPVKKTAKKGQA